jgi:hypothetical protein
METISNLDKIKKGSPEEKALTLLDSVKQIRYGMVMYIYTDGDYYYKEVMRKQYAFENQGEYKSYLDYFSVKVRDKKCFISSSALQW